MATEPQGTADEAERGSQSHDTGKEPAQRASSEDAGSDAQQQANDELHRAISQAIQPALSRLQERAAQPAEERGNQAESQAPASDEKRKGARRRRTNPPAADKQTQGSDTMETESNQTSQEDTSDQESSQSRQPEQQTHEQLQPRQQTGGSSSRAKPPARRAQSSPTRQGSTPGARGDSANVVRVGRLQMAREWRDKGSVYEALHAYEEILAAYPGTGVAAAATQDLVEMAQKLEAEGKFRAALDIFQRLEQLGVDR